MNIQTAIQRIIRGVRKNCLFDAHYVISQLIKHHKDAYLVFASRIGTTRKKTEIVHKRIAHEIDSFDGITIQRQPFRSFSENIRGRANHCTCWRKL